METSKKMKVNIAPLIPDTHPKENNIKKVDCCDFLQCGTCSF
jgi:hypothetical protein